MQGDAGSQGQGAPQGEPTGTGAPTGQEPTGEGQQQPAPSGGNSLSSDFLQRVPEEHRELLKPYLEQWDAGVTRRFQDIHSQYRPYTELGMEPSQLQQAVQVFRMLDEQPQVIYNLLKAELESGGGQQGGQEPGIPGLSDDDLQGLPPALLQHVQQQNEQIGQMRQVLELLAQGEVERRGQTEQQQQDKQLEQYMELLHKEHGEFDDDYVLSQMARGKNGDEAVSAFKKLFDGYTPVNKPPAPRVLSGGGVMPSDTETISKAPRKQVQSMVANMLEAAARESS